MLELLTWEPYEPLISGEDTYMQFCLRIVILPRPW